MSSYSNNQPHLSAMDEEIDIKDLFSVLEHYKRSILSFAGTITFIALLYAYFSTSIFQASLSLQINDSSLASAKTGSEDFMATALDARAQNIDNEIAVLKSFFIAQKALQKVNIGTRYYTSSGLRKVELYRDSPLVVNADAIVERLIGQEFTLYPISETQFRLSIKPSLKTKIADILGILKAEEKPVAFEGTFTYNTPIETPYFRMSVNKVAPLLNNEYHFTITPNEFMFSWIQESLTVAPTSEKGSVLQLVYEDNIPERGQIILNSIAEAYKEQSIEAKNTSAKGTLEFIDQQLKGIHRALENSATNLENFKSSHIVIDPKEKGIIATQKLSELQTQRNEIEMQESVLVNLLNYINSNKDSNGIDAGSMSQVSAPILSLIEKIQAADNARTSMVIDYTENHPSVIKVTEQMVKLKANLRATIESSLRGLRQRQATLDQIIAQQNTALEEIPAQEKQLSQLSNSFSVNQKVYEYLLQKRAETAIVESSSVSAVRIIDAALVGADPIKPKKLLIVIVGMIVGVLVGIAQAFLRNYLANTIQTISDIEKHTSLPLYSVLPLFGERKSLYKDALRVFFTKLEFNQSDPKPKLITFTSSVQGEGRTTTVLELAKVMGNSGKRVIVLDMDMRGSKIAEYLKLNNEYGMSTLLTDRSTLESVIRNISPNADVITSGPISEHPYDLIMSDTFKNFLVELRASYDYILLLSPPAGLVADALVLIRMADLSLIVFKAGYSKKDFLSNTNRFVQEHGLHNVGTVLNALELKKIRPWLRK